MSAFKAFHIEMLCRGTGITVVMFVLAREVHELISSVASSRLSRGSDCVDSSCCKWVNGGLRQAVWRAYPPQINKACPVPGLKPARGQLSNRSPGPHHYKRRAQGLTFKVNFPLFSCFSSETQKMTFSSFIRWQNLDVCQDLSIVCILSPMLLIRTLHHKLL